MSKSKDTSNSLNSTSPSSQVCAMECAKSIVHKALTVRLVTLNSLPKNTIELSSFVSTRLPDSTIKLTHKSDSSKECYVLKSGICVGWALAPGEICSFFDKPQLQHNAKVNESEFVLPEEISNLITTNQDLGNRLVVSIALDHLIQVKKLESMAESLIQKLESVLLEIDKHRLYRMNPSRSTLLQNIITIHQMKLHLNELQKCKWKF